jgi:general secretion pathway protein A
MELPYLAFFGLKEEPFSTVPSPRYFFLTSVHATALEKAAYVVGAQKGLSVVFGDTGTGKSSLARLLHQKFLDSGFLSSLLVNPNYPTANSLLRTIAQELGTPQTSKSFKGMLDLFKEHLWNKAVVEGQTVVLIIDEAQTLKPPLLELLRQLINYETNDMKLLQLVLCAQDELRNTLSRPSLRNFRSRFVMASTLEPLSLSELQAMVSFRWQVASGGAKHPFAPAALEALYEHSAGMPREANILADNALLLGFLKQERLISRDAVERVWHDRQENLSRKEVVRHA